MTQKTKQNANITESIPELSQKSDRKKELQMRVDTSVFESRSVLKDLEVSKDGWDELGWDLAGARAKNGEHG